MKGHLKGCLQKASWAGLLEPGWADGPLRGHLKVFAPGFGARSSCPVRVGERKMVQQVSRHGEAEWGEVGARRAGLGTRCGIGRPMIEHWRDAAI